MNLDPVIEADNNSSMMADTKIDWSKVGKLYRPDSAVESIISNEVDRLRRSLAMSMDFQDENMAEDVKNKIK